MIAKEGPERIVVVRRLLPIPKGRSVRGLARSGEPRSLDVPGRSHQRDSRRRSRVGGRFRIVMTDARGEVEHRGQYPKIEPPSGIRKVSKT